jgi:cell wall-associated NlpC family hydrolase
MRRLLPLLVALLACPSAPAATPAETTATTKHWADAEIRAVVRAGLMAPSAAGFRPDALLTRGEAAQLVAGLAEQPPVAVADPRAPVTMAGLNSRLVKALGLQDAGAQLTRTARAAGLRPPARFGAEVVARLLGLRKNHPADRDELERLPNDAASRAEAAYSVARILELSDWERERARAAAAQFAFADLTGWQRRVLATAFGLVGYPYVWGGESDTPSGPYGPQAQGGFDCSGFVWRVYKLQTYTESAALASVIRGRSSYAMSGETPRRLRIPFGKLAPGDVLFFGTNGPRSKPGQVDHVGIYVAPGWFVHSSRDGVTLTPFAGWYRERFAWARRPLAEAGLADTAAPA